MEAWVMRTAPISLLIIKSLSYYPIVRSSEKMKRPRNATRVAQAGTLKHARQPRVIDRSFSNLPLNPTPSWTLGLTREW